MTGKAKTTLTREFITHAIREMGPTAIPEDASVVGLTYQPEHDSYEVVLCSEKFPETPEGARVQKAASVTAPAEFAEVDSDA